MEFKSVGIKGLGYYVPEKVMTNFDFEKILDTTDEWIRTMTGVEERRYAAPEQAAPALNFDLNEGLLFFRAKAIIHHLLV